METVKDVANVVLKRILISDVISGGNQVMTIPKSVFKWVKEHPLVDTGKAMDVWTIVFDKVGGMTAREWLDRSRWGACTVCGEEFACTTRAKKFCSHTCRDEHYKKVRNASRAAKRVRKNKYALCEYCDKDFGAKRADARFCSPRCRVANSRLKG